MLFSTSKMFPHSACKFELVYRDTCYTIPAMIYIIHRFCFRWLLPAFKMSISNLYARGIRIDQGNSGNCGKNNDGFLLKPVEEKRSSGKPIIHWSA